MPTTTTCRHRAAAQAAAAVAALFAAMLPGRAAEQATELDLFALDDLLKTETSVVSQVPKTLRDSPGVVTVVTREEIASTGARDLIDVLMLVPGFSFGTDVQGVVGPGFRGNWGHEGKVLFMVDGIELNEPLFSTVPLGNHFPVTLIERVEVIRGPGSVIYGGSAELAVVNIVTRGIEDFRGLNAQAEYGQTDGTYARRGVSVMLNHRTQEPDALGVSLSGYFGQGQRSGGTYRDFAGGALNMRGASGLDPTWINAGVQYKDFYARFIYDDYQVTSGDGADVVVDPTRVGFTSFLADARYEWKLSPTLTLVPRLQFRNQTPWQVNQASSPLFYDKSAQRVLGRVSLRWEPLSALHVTVGGEFFEDSAWLNSQSDEFAQSDFGGSTSVVYDNVAGFTEVLFDNAIANLVAGARLEHHSAFGTSFVPRLGATKVMGPFHAKVLMNFAFRAPSIENINQNPAIKPERTQVYEAELGYQISQAMLVSANVFAARIRDPIIFSVAQDPRDPAAYIDQYQNAGVTGTRGLELEYEVRYPWMRAALSYSYYSVMASDDVAIYQVPGHNSLHLGLPAHKVALSGAVRPWRGLNVAPSVVFMSDRFGYTQQDAQGDPVLEDLGTAWLVNLYVSYRDLGVEGLELGLGLYNLTDERFSFVQPYAGGHAPLPALGREVMLRLGYTNPW